MCTSPAALVIGASKAIGSALVNQLAPDHQAERLRLVARTAEVLVAMSGS